MLHNRGGAIYQNMKIIMQFKQIWGKLFAATMITVILLWCLKQQITYNRLHSDVCAASTTLPRGGWAAATPAGGRRSTGCWSTAWWCRWYGHINTDLSLVRWPQYWPLIGQVTSILTSYWSGDLSTDLWLLQAAHIPNTDNDFQQFVLSNAR